MQTGNAGESSIEEIKEAFEKNPAGVILSFGVRTPIIEETIFRYLPHLLVKNSPNTRWDIGTVSSLIFALGHNVYRDSSGQTNFSTNIVPIQQFESGIFNWKMIRDRGLPHAIVAHGIINLIGLLGVYFTSSQRINSPLEDRKH